MTEALYESDSSNYFENVHVAMSSCLVCVEKLVYEMQLQCWAFIYSIFAALLLNKF
jgi:hypothetical protein